MRYFFLAYFLSVVLVVGFAGFRGDRSTTPPIEIFDDMDHQAKVKPQSVNRFFADGSGSRKPVAGTVPMGFAVASKASADGGVAAGGFSHGGDFYNSGIIGEFYGNGFPEQVKVDEGFLRLGKERYNIHCAICHAVSGNGAGVTSKYGIPNIANFHAPFFTNPQDPAYRTNGYIFEVITKGKGLMGSYAANITVHERWAIIAWIRTLAISRNEADVKTVGAAKLTPAN